MRSALALSLALAGCWTSSSPPTPAAESAPRSPSSRAAALPAHTIWQGRYQCTQGWTAMRLTLDVGADGRAVAIFDFGALADNPTVPPGSYRLSGRVEEAPERSSLSLSPERWLSQPDGYIMVSLTAETTASRTKMRGRMESPGCGVLELDRVHP